jgi:hypothetical protein
MRVAHLEQVKKTACLAHPRPSRVIQQAEKRGEVANGLGLGFPLPIISRRRHHVLRRHSPSRLPLYAVVPAYVDEYSFVEEDSFSWWSTPFRRRRATSPWGMFTHVRMRPSL